MDNFLTTWCVGGKAASVPSVLQNQSVDLFKNSNCICGPVCWILPNAGAELAAEVSKRFGGAEFCACLHDLGFYQMSVLLLGEYTYRVFLFVCVVFFLFNQQAVLPFITVRVFFYFKF